MGSINTAEFHIPTIDIAPYLEDPASEAAARVVRHVRNACMTVGFFSLVGHEIPRKVQDDVFQAAKRLFALPIEEKRALRHPLLKNRGYEIIGAQALQDDTLPDLKEVRQNANFSGQHWKPNKTHTGLLHWPAHPRTLAPGKSTPIPPGRQRLPAQPGPLRLPGADQDVLRRRRQSVPHRPRDPRQGPAVWRRHLPRVRVQRPCLYHAPAALPAPGLAGREAVGGRRAYRLRYALSFFYLPPSFLFFSDLTSQFFQLFLSFFSLILGCDFRILTQGGFGSHRCNHSPPPGFLWRP